MIESSILEEIGLTKSETKVYLALLKLGESKKDPIVKESQISSSKIYDVTGKLMNKGLVSVIIKNKIKHFKAAPPEAIINFVNKKKTSLEKKERELKKLLPSFNKLMKERVNKEVAEMYLGWKGLESLYSFILNNLKKDQIDYVIGASRGLKKERTERFYVKINRRLKEKGVKLNILFGSKEKSYGKRITQVGGLKYHKSRYLPFNFPTELNIFNENVAIVILTEEPIGLLIKNKYFAQSCKGYFNALWKIAKD